MTDSELDLKWLGIANDEPILFRTGEELTQNDEDGYRVSAFLGRGGSGEVYRLQSERHGQNRIAKIYLPFYYFDRISAIFRYSSTPPEVSEHFFREHESMRIGDREYAALAAVSHPYIVGVHDLKQVSLTTYGKERLASTFGLQHPPEIVYAIIGAFVDGKRIGEYSRTSSSASIVAALEGTAAALDHLNIECQVLHCDVKSDNIIISERSGLPVLVDFGLAQLHAGGNTRFFSVPETLRPTQPPAPARRVLRKLDAAEDVDVSEIWSAFAPWLDRYQFGVLLRTLAEDDAANLTKADRSFLSAVSRKLTDLQWLLANPDRPLGELVGRAQSDRTYPLVRSAVRSGDQRFPSPLRPINVPLELADFTRHPALLRLNRVNQLGLLPARFPGATHTRYLHSLDTFRMARSFVRRLIDRPLFRTIMGPEDVRTLLVASLYHDVNHLPLLHVLQEFPQKKDWPDPFELGSSYVSSGWPQLEELLQGIGCSKPILRSICKPDEAMRVLDRQLSEAEALTASVISSGVDVDKLSYLQLDSLFSGLGFASALPVERLFESADVRFVNSAGSERPVVAFSGSHEDAVEAVVRARWLGFRDLYWCDENRAMMAGVLDVVRAIVSRAEGPGLLEQVFLDSVRLSDHELLARLDLVSAQLDVGRKPLTGLLDGLSSFVSIAGVVDDASAAKALRAMSAADRVKADNEFASAMRKAAGIRGDGGEFVAVDVPERQLDIGGEIWIYDGADIRRPSFEEQYRTRFEAMANRVAVFADERLVELLRDRGHLTPQKMSRWLAEAVSAAGGAGGWD